MDPRVHYAIFWIAPLTFVLVLMPFYIGLLKRFTMGQFIREEGPEHHQTKAGTPTSGGVVIMCGVIFGILLVQHFDGPRFLTEEYWITMAVTLTLAALGFFDDFLKIKKKHNKGISGYAKLAVQGLCGFLVGLYMINAYPSTEVAVFNWFSIDIGWFYPLFTTVVMMGTSNAVNLTDGLDGLAAGTAILSLFAMTVIFNGGFMDPNWAPVYPDLGNFSLIMTGSLLAFFFFNMHPAKIFMGDTGSLAIGGAIATMAILSKSEFWLFLIGGVFVLEALSVILQVASFKLTGKRIFKMSPLHHHFELSGWSETRVVACFVITQLFLCAGAVFLYNM